jgi:TM2 domain-containing membrane protein YozV
VIDAPNQAPVAPTQIAGPNEQFCRSCGRLISKLALACPSCGAPTSDRPKSGNGRYSDKSRLAALLLCFFLGIFGAHRFYVGKIGTGLLQVVTFGGLGIWALVDFILIAIGEFTDKQEKKVKVWMVDQ